VPELNNLLHENGFNGEFYGAFSALPKGLKERIMALIERIAVTLHLIPKTMRGKEFSKRIFFGKLIPLPPEIKDGMTEYTLPIPISSDFANFEYKVIYAVARLE
jgi:hypothetical protein